MDFLKPTTSYDVLIQTPHSSVITPAGVDHASATTTIHKLTRGVGLADSEFGEAGAEINLEQWGIYYDDLARIDGEWKFSRREFVPVSVGPGSRHRGRVHAAVGIAEIELTQRDTRRL
jgi:hypothetical protein